MKKNERFHIRIEDLGENGEGIGRLDGYTLFVKDALIGDEIEGIITKAKKNYGFGRLLSITTPGPDRVEAKCPAAGPCGGCQLQCLSYKAQLKFKQKKVREHLVRIGEFDAACIDSVMEPIIGAEDPWRYRNKVQVPFARRNDRVIYGFYAKRTHSVIARDDCLIEQEGDAKVLRSIRDLCEELGVLAYDEKLHEGTLRHVLIRSSKAGERLVCLVINAERKNIRRRFPQAEIFAERLFAECEVNTVTLNLNPEKTNVILGEDTVVLLGDGYITERLKIGGKEDNQIEYRISTRSFFQVNSAQTEQLYRLAVDFMGLTGNEEVWDLYCGIGSISLFAAKNARRVRGVEIIPEAVADARENAKKNGIINAEFICGKAEQILPQAVEAGARADVVIVDPPRKGCAPKLLAAIAAAKPERIVYISCNSATLARDLKVLKEKGYEPKRVRPVDMFPMTAGVETVCLLINRKPDS